MPAAPRDDCKIVTFYSYKGGTGRSMALANVAWILATNGFRVLAVDWDLEAPGLHRYFHPFLIDKSLCGTPGLMDLIWDFANAAVTPVEGKENPRWYEEYTDLLDYTTSLDWSFQEISGSESRKGCLDLLPAGRQGASYAARVNSFDWPNFYDRLGGGHFLEAVRRRMRSDYDLVLIDSRTGVSDTSGICTVQMPDHLVVCFNLNNQSIEGAAAIASSVAEQRPADGFRIFPVPMRIDEGEATKVSRGRELAKRKFHRFLWHQPAVRFDSYWTEIEFPYVPFHAYEETLAEFSETEKLLRPMRRLASLLTGHEVLDRPPRKKKRQEILEIFERRSEDFSLEDLESSEEYFRRALEFHGEPSARKDFEALGEALGSSKNTYEKLVEQLSREEDLRTAGGLLKRLGEVSERLRPAESPACYHLALKAYRSGNDPRGCARVNGKLAHVEIRRGRSSAAIDCLQKAQGYYRRAGDEVAEKRIKGEIEGLLKAVERDIVGHYLKNRPEAKPPVKAYLESLWERLSPLPFLAVKSQDGQAERTPFAELYVDLDVTLLGSVEPKASEAPGLGEVRLPFPTDDPYEANLKMRLLADAEKAWRGEQNREKKLYCRRLTALEAAAASRRLVLLGAAGSGKTTFARYLALNLAGEALGRNEANLHRLSGSGQNDEPAEFEDRPWPHGLLPIYVELRNLMRSEHFVSDTNQAGQLFPLLREQPVDPLPRDLIAELEGKEGLLEKGGVLLILDGIDEIPTDRRGRLHQLISSFAAAFPSCHVLVTSRPEAYAQSPLRLDDAGFEAANLAPFNKEKIKSFLRGWRRQLAAHGPTDPSTENRPADLWRDLRDRHDLLRLAARPLMLAMMADLHAAGLGWLGAGGGGAELYERSTQLLLDRWNEAPGIEDGTESARTAAEDLGLDARQIRRALERLAYQAQRGRGETTVIAAGEIDAAELMEAFVSQGSSGTGDRGRAPADLHQRSGILESESPGLFRFPHRSYQEYLAACYLTRTRFPRLLCEEVRAEPTWWREVILLAVGKVAPTPFMAWTLIGSLVVEEPPTGMVGDDPRFLLALYSALAIDENELWQTVEDEDRPRLENVRCWLERILVEGALPAADRAAAGRILGTLEDRRPGVGLSSNGLPDIEWVEIPGGPFRMGSSENDKLARKDEKDQHPLTLDTFHISRFPVTNAQFAAFVADKKKGYRQQRCWSAAGKAWKGDRTGPDIDPERACLIPNHPRVRVNWYEAEAFCQWLSECLEPGIQLPSEAEWEKAARGPDGRVYPWGDKFDPELCEVRATTAVGALLKGAGPYGVLDTSGNVREWTRSIWGKNPESPDFSYPYIPNDEREEIAGASLRVVRGGSFLDLPADLRCARRRGLEPGRRDHALGFRVRSSKVG